ncbi:hypothetical protein ACFVTX_13905 [Agromyces sp. NPDC058136]|uniref:hypothetical protein n=1 Tax=Agromyces sp. NPDC058136 TaxID=3346354 RepID=UPI0036DF19B1
MPATPLAERSAVHAPDSVPAPRKRARATWPVVAVVVGAIVVFAAHFRPWEGGLYEEWTLARYWQLWGGRTTFAAFAELMLSRPLHLVPTFTGVAIGGGEPSGIFVVMGLVAAGQFLAVLWALRPISRSIWINIGVALVIGLHPLWPGGFLQRFLPAQTSILALLIAAGFMIRWLQQGRARWLIGACLALLLGFAVYQGPAGVAPILAIVLALTVSAGWRRKILLVVAATASTVVMALYAIVIVRIVVPPERASYELMNLESSGAQSPSEVVRLVGGTLVGEGRPLLLGIFVVVALGALLSLTRAIPYTAGWLMAGVALASPVCAFVYFGNVEWLQDIDRVGFAVALALSVALLIWPITAAARPRRLQLAVTAVLVAIACAGAAAGIAVWQPYLHVQQRLLGSLAPIVHETADSDTVVVVDYSGTFGDLLTLPNGYLSGASFIANHDATNVLICYPPDGSHPVPAGNVFCDPDTLAGLRSAGDLTMPGGTVDFYVGTVDEAQFLSGTG